MERRCFIALIAIAITITGCSQGGETPPKNAADAVDASLAKAIIAGDEAKVSKVLDSKPELVNKVNADGQTPLHYAAKAKNAAIIRLLLSKGADASLHNDEDETPADVAKVNNAGADIVQLLKGGAS